MTTKHGHSESEKSKPENESGAADNKTAPAEAAAVKDDTAILPRVTAMAREKATDEVLADAARHQAADSLYRVSNAAIIGEIMRRIEAQPRAAATNDTQKINALSLGAIVSHGLNEMEAAGIFRPSPDGTREPGPLLTGLFKIFQNLWGAGGPIVQDWIIKNLPAILEKLLGGLGA